MKKAFTVLELMIVVAIIFLLAAIVIPNLVKVHNRQGVQNETVVAQ